jgi:hypothetical protein
MKRTWYVKVGCSWCVVVERGKSLSWAASDKNSFWRSRIQCGLRQQPRFGPTRLVGQGLIDFFFPPWRTGANSYLRLGALLAASPFLLHACWTPDLYADLTSFDPSQISKLSYYSFFHDALFMTIRGLLLKKS